MAAPENTEAAAAPPQMTPGLELVAAAAKGDLRRLRQLLAQRAPVNVKDADGMTALHYAAAKGHIIIMKTLLNRKAPVDAKAADGTTPLCKAAENGHATAVRMLLAKGANPSAAATPKHPTPLLVAAERGHAGVVEALLKKGADPNIKNPIGITLVVNAIQKGQAAVVSALVAGGVDPNSLTSPREGMSLLALAAKCGQGEVITALCEAGAYVNAPDARGDTALHKLVHYWRDTKLLPESKIQIMTEQYCAAAQALLNAGADPWQLNYNGVSPLNMATDKGILHATQIMLATVPYLSAAEKHKKMASLSRHSSGGNATETVLSPHASAANAAAGAAESLRQSTPASRQTSMSTHPSVAAVVQKAPSPRPDSPVQRPAVAAMVVQRKAASPRPASPVHKPAVSVNLSAASSPRSHAASSPRGQEVAPRSASSSPARSPAHSPAASQSPTTTPSSPGGSANNSGWLPADASPFAAAATAGFTRSNSQATPFQRSSPASSSRSSSSTPASIVRANSNYCQSVGDRKVTRRESASLSRLTAPTAASVGQAGGIVYTRTVAPVAAAEGASSLGRAGSLGLGRASSMSLGRAGSMSLSGGSGASPNTSSNFTSPFMAYSGDAGMAMAH